MAKVLHAQSTLTDRYQTTIPEPIRKALHLSKHDKIDYVIEDNGKVVISLAEKDDPVLGDFLSFLVNDIKKHPEHIKPINSALFSRAQSLVADIDVALDEPLLEKDE
jgi:antitoxin PrlF